MSAETPSVPADRVDDGRVTPDEWRAVKAVVQAALALPREARAAYVDEACADSPRIRREVLSLLDAPDTDPGDDAFVGPPIPGLLDALAMGADGVPAGGVTTMTDIDGVSLDALWVALADRYVVERRIGRGGMATVHLAHDRRHDRPVAIKVLHPRLATIVGRERFLREITLTAGLRHPNLLPLYDSGSDAGQLWFAMPYVAGETLRARLARSPRLPVADAVALSLEIAGAIAHAHARGIVHRDIKPENVLLEPGDGDGARPRALVADFGIARAIDRDTGALLTRTGFAIGTPRYMAPEQARGERDVATRADVYALGAVLHEMLAGEPPKLLGAGRRPSDAERGDAFPAIAESRPDLPAPLAAVVTRAIARDPEARFADASAFAAALSLAPLAPPGDLATITTPRVPGPGAAPADDAATPAPIAASDARERRPAGVVWLAAATLAIGALGGWQAARLRDLAPDVGQSVLPTFGAPAAPVAVRRAFVAEAGALGAELPALTPDGRTLIVAQDDADGSRLYARSVDGTVAQAGDRDERGAVVTEQLLPRALAGTEGARFPFVSPDGRWLGFVAGGVLRRVAIGGGTSQPIATLPTELVVGGAAWSGDGEIVVADAGAGVLYRVAATGGPLERVAAGTPMPGLRDPAFVPGRRAVLVTLDDCCAGRIATVDLVTGTVRELRTGRTPRVVDGWLVFAIDGGTLVRQRFDASRITVDGIVEPIATGIDVSPGRTAVAVSATGASLVRTLPPGATERPGREALRLAVRDRAGRVVRTLDARVPWTPRWSPDGTTLLYGAAPTGSDASEVWTAVPATGAVTRRTDEGRDANDAHWSPDGRLVAYSANASGGKRVVVRPVAGGESRALGDPGSTVFPTGWTPDGRAVLATVDRGGNLDIVALPLDGGPARTVLATQRREGAARLTRDGRWLAYESDATGSREVYVLPYPVGGAQPIRVSGGGGVHPVWRADGRELFYWQGDRLVVVEVRAAPDGGLRFGTPTTLFRARYPDTLFPMYDVSPDGTRIVIAAGAPDGERFEVVRAGR
jgi:serine/threonine-protein kinase